MNTPNELVEENHGFAVSVAKSYARKHPEIDLEDVKQSALLGLTIAANKFDPHRGVKFTSYASYWVRNKIIEELRLQWGYINKRSDRSDQKLKTLNSEEITAEEYFVQEENLVNRVSDKVQLEEVLGRLSEKDQNIILDRIYGLSFKRIGSKIGVTGQRVHERQSNAFEKLGLNKKFANSLLSGKGLE